MYYGISGPFETELQLNNQVGQSIAFYTDRIPAGATVLAPHTEGTVVVTTSSGITWTYSSVDVAGPELQSDVRREHLRLTLPLNVEPSGTLLFASGKRIEPLSSVTKQ